MKRKMLSMLAMSAILIAGESAIAGEAGMVKLNKDVYEVGEKEATVTVTDGTGGYKAGPGKGFAQVSAGFSGKGDHPITISNKPSEALNDSGVVVTYPAPLSGEEEKSVTAYCTVVKFELNIAAIPNYHELPNGKTIFIESAPVSGIALPKSSYKIPITTKIEGGDRRDWVPWRAVRHVSYGDIDTKFYFRLRKDGISPIATKFVTSGTYLGIFSTDDCILGEVGQ